MHKKILLLVQQSVLRSLESLGVGRKGDSLHSVPNKVPFQRIDLTVELGELGVNPYAGICTYTTYGGVAKTSF